MIENSSEILEDMKSQFHVVNHVMKLFIGISRTIKTYSLSNNEEPKIISEISYFGNRSKVCYFLHLQIRYWIDKYCLSIIIGAELGGAAGARAPPLLHNPRNFIVLNVV